MSSSSSYLAGKNCCIKNIEGPQGSKGYSGYQGSTGLAGYTGSQGSQGKNGKGQRGSQGPQGPPFGSNYFQNFTLDNSANFTYNSDPDFQQLYLFPTNITLPEGSYEINWSFNSVIPVSIESYLYVEFIGLLDSYQTNVYTLSEPCPTVSGAINIFAASGSEIFTIGTSGDTVQCAVYFKGDINLSFDYNFNIQINPNPLYIIN